jgi:hypothetical protein
MWYELRELRSTFSTHSSSVPQVSRLRNIHTITRVIPRFKCGDGNDLVHSTSIRTSITALAVLDPSRIVVLYTKSHS